MSEDPTNKSGGPSKETADLISALREMGQQFESVFHAAIESEQVKQLQSDLTLGVRQISAQVESAVKSVQSDPRFQQANERGREALHQAQQSKVVQDVQEALVVGVGQLNEQLRKVIDRLQTAGTPSSGPTTQDVPIDHEPPATGKTTKLDE